MNIEQLNKELKSALNTVSLSEDNKVLNTEGRWLFKNYGTTAEEVLGTINAAIQFIEPCETEDGENYRIADSLKDIHALLEKLWYENK